MDKSDIVDILLVEDDPNDAEMLVRAFKKCNIANPLHVVMDGAEALDFIFCRGAYAGRDIALGAKVILLDLKLPKVSGMEVLKAIKSDERKRNIPVVIVTSSQEDPDIKKAYALGANSYVIKPVNANDFIDAMSKMGMYWLLTNKAPK